MSATVHLALDTEDVHDLLMGIGVIEMLSEDDEDEGPASALAANLISIGVQLADALSDAGHVVRNEGMRLPSRTLLESVALYVLGAYRKNNKGKLVEK